jgi:hypothetical protein
MGELLRKEEKRKKSAIANVPNNENLRQPWSGSILLHCGEVSTFDGKT